MTMFDERERAFESKFKHDEELQFRVFARRARLLGLWAAEKLGLAGAEAEAYSKQVVAADFEEAGHDDIVRKVHADLVSRGLDISAHRVEKEAINLLQTAKQQIMTQ